MLLVLHEGEARTFEELYQAVVPHSLGNLYAAGRGRSWSSGKCVRSQLMSVRDCQSVAKKAIVDRLLEKHRVSALPETGAPYPVDIAIHSDLLRVTLDMSGDALNRRGYRTWNGEAPLRETLGGGDGYALAVEAGPAAVRPLLRHGHAFDRGCVQGDAAAQAG